MKEIFTNVYVDKKRFYVPGDKSYFEERILSLKGKKYRQWDPSRSKLGAAIAKGIKEIGIEQRSIVLYLGSGHGFTPSFVSGIASQGMIFALDFSPRVVRDLIFLCEENNNMAPILGDANKPDTYSHLVPKKVDVLFQDVAQKNQLDIFLKNMNMYLKKGGYGLLALKARSVDVTKKPKKIFSEVYQELKKKTNVIDWKDLHPFEKDHALFVCRN